MAQMQINPSQIKMVFFDAGGTLFDVAEPVGNTYAMIAQQHGKIVSPELLQQNFGIVFKQMPPLSFGNDLAEEALVREEYQWWFQLVSQVFSDCGEFKNFSRFFADVYFHYEELKAWKLFDDVIPALEKLREMRIKIGVISNFDSRLNTLLEGFGLAKYFDTIHISSRVGSAKPQPEIFNSALQANKILPSEAVHIGDSLIEDYQAAINAGLSAWLIERKQNAPDLSLFLESFVAD